MNLSEIKVGSPYLFKSDIYGDVAVHVESIHNEIIKITVDGGESARQVINHPELLDGHHVIAARLHKRPGVRGKAAVTNTIREVPGVGQLAVVETSPLAKRGRRFGLERALTEARKIADRNPTHFKWTQGSTEEVF